MNYINSHFFLNKWLFTDIFIFSHDIQIFYLKKLTAK